MDLVALKCAKCDAKLGSLVNLWTQIGKKYVTPVAYAEDTENPLKVLAHGSIRFGDAGTLIEGCELQDAECTACHTSLGQKCLKSPVNHVLKDDQVIFRIASIVLKLVSDLRRKTEPKIQRVLKLRGDPSSAQGQSTQSHSGHDVQDNSPSQDKFEIIQIQADLESQQEEIQRIGAAGFQVMSSFETTISRFEKQMRQLNDSIDGVRKEGEGQRDNLKSLKSDLTDVKWNCQNDFVVSRLDQQLQTTDRVVTELRQAINQAKSESNKLRNELTTTQHELQQVKDENASLRHNMDETKQIAQEGITTSKLYVSEVASLRREIKQLRSELAHERAHSPAVDNSSLSSHQLDILASNISKIGNRASQIESLQMDFELFRTRVQRLEARASSTPSTNRNDSRTTSMVEHSSQHDQSRYGWNTRQKRPSMGREDSQNFDSTPPKRMAISSDYPSAITAGYVSASEVQQSSPIDICATGSPVQRRTKTVSAGRTKIRRGTWKTKK